MKGRILIILLISIYACNPARHEMPITTSSKEARELFIKGRDMWECREPDKANEFLKQAIELDSNFAMAYYYYQIPAWTKKAWQLKDKVSSGECLLLTGGYAYLQGDFDLADLYYDSLLLMYPKDEHCWLMAGTAYKNRDVDKAIECYKKAIDLDPYHAGAHRRLGIALM